MQLAAMELFQHEISNRGFLSPELRVFSLSVLQTNNPQTYPQPLEVAGASLFFDPEGAELLVTLLVALDAFEIDVDNFITISPGVTYNFRPAGFTRLFVRTLSQYTDSDATRRYIGRLVVSPSMVAPAVGASAAAPVYTRKVPSVFAFTTAYNNNRTGTNNFADLGGTGIFTSQIAFPLVSAAAPNTGSRVTVKNIGSGNVYVSPSSTLTNPALMTQIQQTFELAPRESVTFEAIATLNTRQTPTAGTFQSVNVYAGDLNAAICVVEESFR